MSRQDNEAFIDGLYSSLLGRPAEAAELEERIGHMDGGMSPAELVWEIYKSPEAVARREEGFFAGARGVAFSRSPEEARDFVASAYEATVSRTPAPEEIDACLAALSGGLTASSFIKGLHQSEEAGAVRATREYALREGCFDLCIESISKALGRATSGVSDTDLPEGLASLRARVDEWLMSEQGLKTIDDFRKASVAHLVERKELAWIADPLSEEARRRLVAALYLGVFGRTAESQEIAAWATQLAGGLAPQELVYLLVDSDEGRFLRSLAGISQSPEHFVQLAGRVVLGEAYTAHEIADRIDHIRRHGHSPLRYLMDQFGTAVRRLEATPPAAQKLDILGNLYMVGHNKPFDMRVWFDEERHAIGGRRRANGSGYGRPRKPGTVTAVASVYKGDRYIKAFMDNMVSQTIFDESVTLIIIDAASPQNEAEVIAEYTETHKNIIYVRTATRIGIYDAWNQAIKKTGGDYITNVNLDDLRREDSLEIQRDMLDDLEFADVVYQDFYYSLDSNISYQEIERRNLKCKLPHITLTNLVHFNSPHNGPMWRRRLHDELGYYSDEYRSAGDCDFWIRCCEAGKVFVKSNEPHVAYYVNPQGLSTHADTLGFTEHAKIKRHFGTSLVHEAFVEDKRLFAERIGVTPEMIGDRARYDVVTDRMLALAQDA